MDGSLAQTSVPIPGWVGTVISVASAIFIAVVLLLFFVRRRRGK
jgi:preprotein translocase subunit SecF